MARLEDNDMVFLLERRHKTESPSMRVSFSESPLAEPMRRALSGESGTTVAIDYRGETVLAAFEPVSEVNVGIVAKIDLAEIRQPFTRAAIAGLGASTLLILIGGMAELLQYNLKAVRSYLLKEDFQQLWSYSSKYWAGKFIDKWCTRAMRSKIDPMKKVAKQKLKGYSAAKTYLPAPWPQVCSR